MLGANRFIRSGNSSASVLSIKMRPICGGKRNLNFRDNHIFKYFFTIIFALLIRLMPLIYLKQNYYFSPKSFNLYLEFLSRLLFQLFKLLFVQVKYNYIITFNCRTYNWIVFYQNKYILMNPICSMVMT